MAELEPLYPYPPSSTIHDQPHSSESKSSYVTDKNVEEGVVAHTPGSGPSIQDILSFVVIAIMLIWPWIFFGVVWAKGGIQMNDHLAKVITNHPQATTYFVTFICSIISLITSELFSLAIVRFAQELVTYRKPTHPFHLTVLLAYRHQTWPWGKSMKDARYLLAKNRWWPAASVIVCALIFPHLISSTTTLLTPTSFNRTAILTGTELNFSSTDAACLAWFDSHPVSNNCTQQQQVYNGQGYINCLGGSQTVDFLEAGRGKVLEFFTDSSESITFNQLGAGDGLHFEGSVKGVLPLGPNGVFNTSLDRSPLSDPKTSGKMISYDYTLNLQGLTSNVSCFYTPTYPFRFQSADGVSAFVLAYNASCSRLGEVEVLTNITGIESANSNNLLVYWACQSAPNGTRTASYTIYLAGLANYGAELGNITCIVDPIQAAIYPVMYRSTGNIFSTAGSTTPSPLAFSALINYTLIGLGSIITDAQSLTANLFAEPVFDLGQKFFDPSVNQDRSGQYLQLFERMIQGVIEYEMTYLRLIYSALPNPPASCLRKVTGSLNYEVHGWFMTVANIGFLIPLTIINLGALVALAGAMIIAKDGGYMYHPSHPRPVVYDKHIDRQEQIPDEWMYKVSVRPTTNLDEYFDKNT